MSTDAKVSGKKQQRVAVLGASANPERYAHKAMQLLRSYGHEVIPINPAQKVIDGLPVMPSLKDVKGPVDTVTVYVGPMHSTALIPELIAAKPGRVILNPGAESPELEAALQKAGIATLQACTLVLLRTSQF